MGSGSWFEVKDHSAQAEPINTYYLIAGLTSKTKTTLFSSESFEFDKNGSQFSGSAASKVDLSGISFVGTNLSGVDLSNKDLNNSAIIDIGIFQNNKGPEIVKNELRYKNWTKARLLVIQYKI